MWPPPLVVSPILILLATLVFHYFPRFCNGQTLQCHSNSTGSLLLKPTLCFTPVLTPLPGTFGFLFIHILHHHIDKLLNNLTGWATVVLIRCCVIILPTWSFAPPNTSLWALLQRIFLPHYIGIPDYGAVTHPLQDAGG